MTFHNIILTLIYFRFREVDSAMLRRLEKRIYIPLPDPKTRAQLFETYLNARTVEMYPKVDYDQLAAKTDGYSGSDVKLACKEALMTNVRKMLPNALARSKCMLLFNCQDDSMVTSIMLFSIT